MRLIETPSPNHGPRVGTEPLDILVLHFTGMRNAADALTRLCDPVAEVSSHYTIDTDGTIHAHVPEHLRAWHAGPSHWRCKGDVNSRSIGFEIVNPGHDWGLAPFPEAQIAAVIALSRAVIGRHVIPARNVVAHSDIAPTRKADPGELFPWRQLAAAGVGLWPDVAAVDPVEDPEQAMRSIGYCIDNYGPEACLKAFQRRYRPARIDGLADAETRLRLGQVLRKVTTSP